MKNIELTIEDDALPAVLTALGQIKGLVGMKVEPKRVRPSRAKAAPPAQSEE